MIYLNQTTYKHNNLEKFFETEKLVKGRRGKKLSTVEKELIEKIIL